MVLYDAIGEPIIRGPTSRWTAHRRHATQEALARCEKRFIVVEAPRRSGKTEIFKRIGVENGWMNERHDDYLVVFAAPTRDQAKQIYWEDINALIPQKLVRRRSESKLFTQLWTGTTYQVVGMDRPQRIEGRPIDWIGCDEFAEWRKESYDKTVRPSLSTPGRPGKACFYGVPRPSPLFREMANRAKDPKNAREWAYFWWDSVGILDEDEIQSARETMAPRMFEQEYRGLRVSYAGRAYYTFDRVKNDVETTYDPRLPLRVCFDFNVDPGVAVILQVQDYNGPVPYVAREKVTCVLDEVWIPDDSNTNGVCRAVLAKWAKLHKGEVRCYGDRNGGSRHTSQSQIEGPDWKQIRDIFRDVDQGGFTGKVSVHVKNANPSERERVNVVCNRLCSTAGVVRMLVPASKAPRLRDDFEMVTVKTGTDGEIDKKRDETLTHLSDAIGYFEEYEHGGGPMSTLLQY